MNNKVNNNSNINNNNLNHNLDKNNQLLGSVSAIHNFGAGDLLELNGKFKYMIRFYDLNKEDINLKKKIIKLNKNYEI